jgi:hypothetical protein
VHGPGQFESNDTYELLHGIVQAEYIASTIALQMFVVSFRGGPLYYHVPEVDFRLQPIGTIPEAMPTVDYILYGHGAAITGTARGFCVPEQGSFCG